MERGHPTTGLNVLELQGIDHCIGLLVIDGLIPKSSESIRYGLILDYLAMDLDMCETFTKKVMLNSLKKSHVWSPSEIKDEWNFIDEQQQVITATT